MNVSILLRLMPSDDADSRPGELRGQAEVVETGESVLFKDGHEMLAFLTRVTYGDPSDSERQVGFDGQYGKAPAEAGA